MDCSHFFTTTVKREVPSCLGTHRAACYFCGLNYMEHHINVVVNHISKGGSDDTIPHTHCWSLNKEDQKMYCSEVSCDKIVKIQEL